MPPTMSTAPDSVDRTPRHMGARGHNRDHRCESAEEPRTVEDGIRLIVALLSTGTIRSSVERFQVTAREE